MAATGTGRLLFQCQKILVTGSGRVTHSKGTPSNMAFCTELYYLSRLHLPETIEPHAKSLRQASLLLSSNSALVTCNWVDPVQLFNKYNQKLKSGIRDKGLLLTLLMVFLNLFFQAGGPEGGSESPLYTI